MNEDYLKLEAALMQRLLLNDELALADLMKLYYSDLYSYALRFTRDDGLIKDCIQEVFISLWQRRETVGSILSPKFYFIRAIKNKILKSLHRNEKNRTSTGLQDDYDFFHEFSIERIIIEKQISEQRADKLKKILSQLSKRQKEIIYLKYYQYLDHGQIAELMNISRQSVYNLLHEAIRQLRSLWHTEFVSH